MSLVEFWKSSREQIENKTIEQLIAFAGGGKLRDGNDTSAEFRRFLSHVSSDLLQEYVDQCLGKSFAESGFVLQDIVNQVGERLGFEITYGRYQGSSKEIGFDGVWKYPNGHNLIVEIKTTDAYRIDLNRIANYRASLSQEGKISEKDSSILIIVGRNDTGDLEAQIRGSRHAWDMRLISIDALLSLLRTKEELEDPETVRRIYDLLIPREFTKLDEIIELVFSTAEEAKLEELEEEEAEVRPTSKQQTKKPNPVSFNDACAARIEDHLDVNLVKQSSATFSSPDKSVAVVCAVSKEYIRSGIKYWFAFHEHQKDFAQQAEIGYVAYGCGSPENILVIPIGTFLDWVDGFNLSQSEKKKYWHIHITREDKQYFLERKTGYDRINISNYLLSP